MALTKSDIVQNLAQETGMPKHKSSHAIERLLEIMKRTLASGEDVMVTGFGKFCVKEKAKRRGRNPATGDPLMLSARRVVTFKCSGKLRERCNSEECETGN